MAVDPPTTAPGLGAVARFNPQLWSPAELRAIFVARQRELAQLVQRLHDAAPGQAPQHVLVTGHRGMGKSTLLHRLALAVHDDAGLSAAWVPLLFREEQYTAVALDKLWRNAIDALSEALEREGPDSPCAADVPALDALNQQLDAVNTADEREAQALQGLLAWSTRRERRLLLLVDSTDLLLGNLAQARDGERALWRLRELLSHDQRLCWVGCAYVPLEATQGYNQPFHEFFAPLPLWPLTIDDMRATFLALARTFGAGRGLAPEIAEAQIRAIVEQQPERLETLLRLAGGNPRTTVLLYQLLAAGGHDSVHADLQRLLDDMSALYKDRLETLAVQPRQLLATLMEQWAPMAARELAAATGLPVSQINAQLSRLEADGWIEKVRLPGTRRNGYQAAERFFNVWYLMRLAPRRLRQRLTWLVEFMRLWFAPAELRDLARQRLQAHRGGLQGDERQLEYSRALSLALDDGSRERRQLELTLLPHTVRGRIGELLAFDFDAEDRCYQGLDELQARFARLGPQLRRVQGLDPQAREDWVNLILGSLALPLGVKEHIADAAASLASSPIVELGKVVRDEQQSWQRLAEDSAAVELLFQLARNGEFFPEGGSVALAVIQLDAWAKDDPSAYALGLLVVARHHDGDAGLASAFNAWDCRRVESAALLVRLAHHAARCGCLAAAATASALALERGPKDAETWSGLGNLLQAHLKRYLEAEMAYRRAVALEPKNAVTLNDLGILLQKHLQRYPEAEGLYRRAISLNPKSAVSWNNLGNLLLDHLRRPEDAEAALRQAILWTKADLYPYPQANLARLLATRGRIAEANGAYRQTLDISARQAGADHADLRLQAHLWLGNRDEAARALDSLLSGLDPAPARTLYLLEEQCAECLRIGRGLALAEQFAAHPLAERIRPFELALRWRLQGDEALLAAPLEMQQLAREVAQRLPQPAAA